MEVDTETVVPPAPAAEGMEVDEKAVEITTQESKPQAETIYVHNLNEKVQVTVLKQTLKNLFKPYGKVLGITAHHNVRMRGQAFIAMDTVENAAKAMDELEGFPLYGKPIQAEFAKVPSDTVVKRKSPEELETHKAERVKNKKLTRRNNPYNKKVVLRKEVAKKAAATAEGDLTGAQRRVLQTGEYLPPNKILFIQNLPDTATKQELETLFSKHENFVEVRLIPSRKGIAFVQYEDETSSNVAKDALHNTRFGDPEGGNRIKVTFAKA